MMDLQIRKQHLSEFILNSTDEIFIEKLEQFFKKENAVQNDDLITPMSLDQFYKMIAQAQQDKDQGNVISHDDLKRKIKSW